MLRIIWPLTSCLVQCCITPPSSPAHQNKKRQKNLDALASLFMLLLGGKKANSDSQVSEISPWEGNTWAEILQDKMEPAIWRSGGWGGNQNPDKEESKYKGTKAEVSLIFVWKK